MKIYTCDNCSVSLEKRGLNKEISRILELIQKNKLLTYIRHSNQYILDLYVEERELYMTCNNYLVMALGSISLKIVFSMNDKFLILEKVE